MSYFFMLCFALLMNSLLLAMPKDEDSKPPLSSSSECLDSHANDSHSTGPLTGLIKEKQSMMVSGRRYKTVLDLMSGANGVSERTLAQLGAEALRGDASSGTLGVILSKDPYIKKLIDDQILPSTVVGVMASSILIKKYLMSAKDFEKKRIDESKNHALHAIAHGAFKVLQADQLKFHFQRHDVDIVESVLNLDVSAKKIDEFIELGNAPLELTVELMKIESFKNLAEIHGFDFELVYAAVLHGSKKGYAGEHIIRALAELVVDPKKISSDISPSEDPKASLYIAFDKQDIAYLEENFSKFYMSEQELTNLIMQLDKNYKLDSLRFIANHVNVANLKNHGGTFLTAFCAQQSLARQPDIITALVENGAAINYVDSQGLTPIVAAVLTGNPVLVKTLLNLGAKLTNPQIHDQNGRKLAHFVVLSQFISFKLNNESFGYLEMFAKEGMSWDVKDFAGNTPAHLAAKRSDIQAFRVIYKYGGSITSKNNEGKTPRDILLERAGTKYPLAFIDYLLSGESFDDFINASRKKDIDAIDRMIQNGFSLIVRNEFDRLPIEYAIEFGDDALVLKLLQRDAETHRNPTKDDDRTILHLLAQKGFRNSYRFALRNRSLIFNSFRATPPRNDGVNPEMILRRSGDDELAQYTRELVRRTLQRKPNEPR